MRGAALAACLLLAGSARAARPTEGGLWTYSPEDVLAVYDEGELRVHYSVAGPNAVVVDGDEVPGQVRLVAETAAEVLERFAALGLRAPLREAELGVGDLGGSEAFDIYLVDFGGAADGHFDVDACTGSPTRCSGFFVMENDFAGYGYANVAEAVETVVSHELFHAVQAAYVRELPIWVSEGTATWAERAFRSESRDFVRLCDRYLADTGRSLFKPPAGPAPGFAYGTALWWDFLTTRHEAGLIDELLVAASAGDVVGGMVARIEGRGDTLADAWRDFVAWNLATGPRSADGYAYAAALAGVVAEQEGATIDDDDRFFALAARYYRIDHAGGPLWFGLVEPAPGLQFALHAVEGGAADGPVSAAISQWDGAVAEARELGDLAAGGYWLSVANPSQDDEAIRAHLCVASGVAVLPCVEVEVPEEPAEAEDGCGGCRTTDPGAAMLLTLLLARRRRGVNQDEGSARARAMIASTISPLASA